MIRRSLVTLAVAAWIVGACQSGSPTPSAASLGSFDLGEASPVTDPLSTLGPPPSPTPPDETTPVSLDPTLLDVLPETVGDVALTESVDEATQALANETLTRIASAVDAAVAADAANGNLVYAWVVRLRPGKLTDTIFGQWRDSYDEGACSGAGGVVGRAEATIDGRTVYITSCAQGLRTYHAWLKDQDILISASALGDGRFGELLMDNLRVPS